MLKGRYLAILAFMAVCVHGAPVTMTAAQKESAVFLDALSVPSPGEVFSALNRSCRPNWATLVTTATAPVTTERAQLALAVGVLAADGYIAVEAKEGQQVKNVGREIMNVAKSLGVSQSLMGRGNSLIEFADNNDWDALADELEATENEVKSTMVGQKDRDLVTLTSSAAWLRGLEVATGVVLGSEDVRGASPLKQPELARRLYSQLELLPDRLKGSHLVSGVGQVLEEIATLLETTGLSKDQERENLRRIHEKAAGIVQSIMASAGSQSSPTPAITPEASKEKPPASASTPVSKP